MPKPILILLATTATLGAAGVAGAASPGVLKVPAHIGQTASAAAIAIDPAASDSALRAGQRLGNTIDTWGRDIFLGVAGILGIGVVIKRNVSETVQLVLVCVVVGGLLYASGAVKTLIDALWNIF